MLVLLMEVVYELRRSDRVKCRGICTKFHKDCFRHSEVNMGVPKQTHRHRDTYIIISSHQ
jgi:hypothetical protein